MEPTHGRVLLTRRPDLPRHLDRPVRLTRIGLVAERAVHAFWPVWTVLFAAFAPLMMGWHEYLPLELFWGLAALAGLAFAGALILGIRRFRWPGRAEALARVDAALPGRPISALADSQAIGAGDTGSEALWRAHLARMEARSRAARPVEPDLRVSSRDPYALRYSALLFFVAALLFGSVWRVGSVAQMTPGGGQVLATGPVWEGWIKPPSYTGRPSLYLNDIRPGALEVPEGSQVTLRLYGQVGALSVAETVSERAENPEASAPQQEFGVLQSGAISISGPGGAAWEVAVIPDAPPTVLATGPAQADAMGEMSQPFAARDDYAVTSGTATITLDRGAVERRHGLTATPDPRVPLVLDLPMPLRGDRAEFEEVLIQDLSQHPFANLPVTMVLEVADAQGQTGRSAPIEMILPGRRFFQPIARAVIEQRRDLLWSRDNAPRVAQILRAVSYRPEGFFPDESLYLRLRYTIRQLEGFTRAGLTQAHQDEIAEALWDLAVQLEEGSLADARERLKRAQERLAEAMRNGASEAEIAELMQELREAVNDYTRMLAQQSQGAEGEEQSAEGETFEFTQDELQALMDRIQELMEQGRMAEAAQLMEQLNQLMENMRVTQGQGGPGQQSMEDLAQTLREQQDLSDDSFRDLQDQFNFGPQGRQPEPGGQGQDGQGQPGGPGQGQQPGQNQPGQGPGGQQDGPDPGGAQSLAQRQQALRDELGRQRGNLPNLGGEAAEEAQRSLERADRAMDGAEDALRRGDLPQALDHQAEAMEALREGMRNLGQAMAENQQSGEGQQRGEGAGQSQQKDRDPLGRQLGEGGQFGTDENMLQGEDTRRRAEELLEELRRRSSEQERPEAELDYLRRLLERF